jgi:hypothetical protein
MSRLYFLDLASPYCIFQAVLNIFSLEIFKWNLQIIELLSSSEQYYESECEITALERGKLRYLYSKPSNMHLSNGGFHYTRSAKHAVVTYKGYRYSLKTI